MKIFLGVLGDDVLGVTAGIDLIDPVRLADGMPEETTRVAQLFCWLGKKMDFITNDGSYIDERVAPRADPSLSPSTTADTTVESRLSMQSNQTGSDDQTTVMADESFVIDTDSNEEDDRVAVDEGKSMASARFYPSVSSECSRDGPRCIHELEFISRSSSSTNRPDPAVDLVDESHYLLLSLSYRRR